MKLDFEVGRGKIPEGRVSALGVAISDVVADFEPGTVLRAEVFGADGHLLAALGGYPTDGRQDE